MADAQIEKEEIIGDLKPGKRTIKKLKHNGYLYLEHDVPFLMIYRHIPNDSGTIRLARSEEHTSELQSRGHLVCRLLLEKKKRKHILKCIASIIYRLY